MGITRYSTAIFAEVFERVFVHMRGVYSFMGLLMDCCGDAVVELFSFSSTFSQRCAESLTGGKLEDKLAASVRARVSVLRATSLASMSKLAPETLCYIQYSFNLINLYCE